MVKLRHLSAKTLDELESKIESLRFNPVVLGVNNVNGMWFAHFLLQSVEQEVNPVEIKAEKTEPTQTIFVKKIPRRKS